MNTLIVVWNEGLSEYIIPSYAETLIRTNPQSEAHSGFYSTLRLGCRRLSLIISSEPVWNLCPLKLKAHPEPVGALRRWNGGRAHGQAAH